MTLMRVQRESIINDKYHHFDDESHYYYDKVKYSHQSDIYAPLS